MEPKTASKNFSGGQNTSNKNSPNYKVPKVSKYIKYVRIRAQMEFLKNISTPPFIKGGFARFLSIFQNSLQPVLKIFICGTPKNRLRRTFCVFRNFYMMFKMGLDTS